MQFIGPYNVNCIVAGVDKAGGPGVYFLDYLGNMQKMNFTAHGYAGYFVLSLLDKYYEEGLDEAGGIKLIRMCITELRTRMVISAKYIAKIVDANGVRIIDIEA